MSKSFSEIPEIDVYNLDSAFITGGLCSTIAGLAAEHGPIFKWAASAGEDRGGVRITMVGPEANRFVMHTHRDHFSHDLGWTPILGEAFGRGLLNMDDPEHARHRKMWNPAFTASYMDAYLPVMLSVIQRCTATWPEREVVDIYHECREITFDIAAGALAGFTTGEEMARIRGHFYTLLHGFDESVETLDEYFTRASGIQAELIGILLRMIAERRAAPSGERPTDVLGMIVHARDDIGDSLSDMQVLAHLMILLVAGHETTTTLGAWAIYLLSTMPEHRYRLVREVEDVLAAAGPVPTVEALRAMKQLDNFVRETGRVYPPVINVPRGVVKEFEFGGFTVPAGAQVRLALGACHYLPDIFENPGVFDPDRLAPPREEDKRRPYSLVTFGGGPRVCIGQHFAHIETKALLAHVLRHYDLESVPGQQPVHAGFFNSFIPGGINIRVMRHHVDDPVASPNS